MSGLGVEEGFLEEVGREVLQDTWGCGQAELVAKPTKGKWPLETGGPSVCSKTTRERRGGSREGRQGLEQEGLGGQDVGPGCRRHPAGVVPRPRWPYELHGCLLPA